MKLDILIVEDDRWQADIYRDVLRVEFDVRVCHSAQEAIEVVDEHTPSLILLDMVMPGSNGVAFLQELRSYDDVMSVPVVVCSGAHMSPEQREALAQFSPITVVDKADLTPQKLIETVKELSSARPK